MQTLLVGLQCSTSWSTIVTMWLLLQIKKMTSYLRADKFKRYDEVPDPYFAVPGDQSGFDLVGSCAIEQLLHTIAWSWTKTCVDVIFNLCQVVAEDCRALDRASRGHKSGCGPNIRVQ